MSLTGLIFLLAYGAGLALGLLRHPLFGLYTYLAVFYLHPPSRWWGAFLPDIRWSLVAAIVTLIALWRVKPDPKAPSWIATTPGVVLVLFTIWLWIQSLWALDPFEHREAAVLFTKYVVLYILVYRLIDTPEKATWFLLVHVAGSFYLGCLAYSATVSGRLDGVGGPGIDEANALAMHLGTAVVAGAMLILGLRGWRQIFCLIAMPFILNAIVLAGSRGAFVGILAGAVVLVYLKPQVHRRLFYGFAALGLVLFLMVAHDAFWERMRSITAPAARAAEVDMSTLSRLELLKAQVKMAGEHSFGTGHRGTAVLSPEYLDSRYLTTTGGPVDEYGARSSHNTFMTVWVEQGIPGALLYLALVIWGIRNVRGLLRHATDGGSAITAMHSAAIASGIAIVIFAGVFTDYLKAEIQIWLLAMFATLVYVRIPRESAAPSKDGTRQAWASAAAARGARPGRTHV